MLFESQKDFSSVEVRDSEQEIIVSWPYLMVGEEGLYESAHCPLELIP